LLSQGKTLPLIEIKLNRGTLVSGRTYPIPEFSRESTKPQISDPKSLDEATFTELFMAVRQDLPADNFLNVAAMSVAERVGCDVYFISSDPEDSEKVTVIVAKFPNGEEEIVNL
jgi:hypothetical protein